MTNPSPTLSIPKPKNLTVTEWKSGMTLHYRWRKNLLFSAFLCIVWNTVVAVQIPAMFSAKMPWIVPVTFTPFIIVGIGLAYYSVTCLLNSTVVNVSKHSISVRHGPLPLFRDANIPAVLIANLSIKETLHRQGVGGFAATYGLVVATRDGREVKLLSLLPSKEQAAYFEARLKSFLPIQSSENPTKARETGPPRDLSPGMSREHVQAPQNERIMAPMPETISVGSRGQSLVLRYRWFSGNFVVLALVCLMVDGVLFLWYYLILRANMPLAFFLVPLPFAGLGLLFAYYVIAGFLNRVIVTISKESIILKHRPLPWFGGKKVPAESVKQLYAEPIGLQSISGTSVACSLNILTRMHEKIVLIPVITHDKALYLEQEIEVFLGLPDVHMAGEATK